MRALVEYNVQVLVEIDLDEEVIVGVRVDDERVDGPTAATDRAGQQLGGGDAERAIAVAEGAGWPAWEFGL